MRAEEGFQFPAITPFNRWEVDAAFRAVIIRHLSLEKKNSIKQQDLERLTQNLSSFGQRVRDDYTPISATMNNFREEPYLIQYDAWGKRVDQLVTSAGWKELKKVAAREAIVGESYGYDENSGGGRAKLGGGARVYAFARSIMFGPASKVVLCPISMTDGAVRVLELFGTKEQKEANIPRLVSTDPSISWTAGQFMTERPGGSDVSQTETTATAVDASKTKAGDKFILNGFKWFSSATDGDVALALARTDQSKPNSSKGLSLFLIRLRDDETKKLNGIRVHRLKNKMGTRYLPTAELELDQCVGELVGELGRGVSTISSVLNITRLYSASGALAGLGHGLQIATSFASQRKVMQSAATLSDLPLHTATLLTVVVVYRSLLQLFFHNVLLMGRSESGTATLRESLRLRFLTPALKAFCATRASEGYIVLIESLGGQGYMEENGLAEGLRDLTVERIWEGTPAILSLDLLRVMMQSKGAALAEFIEDNSKALAALPRSVKEKSSKTVDRLQSALQEVGQYMQQVDLQRVAQTSDYRIGRPLLDCVMTIQAGVLLLEQAAWVSTPDNAECVRLAQLEGRGGEDDIDTARLWVLQGHGDLDRSLASLSSLASEQSSASIGQRLVYGSSSTATSRL